MKYEDFLELIKKRRSIRKFTPDPVSDEEIQKILEAARWAPSGFNSQLWEFVVIKTPRLKEKIAEAAGTAFSNILKGSASSEKQNNTPEKRMVFGWETAPVFILVVGDTRVRACSPVPPVKTDDTKWTAVFISSLAIAFQYAALAAVSLGLASQWVSVVSDPSVALKIKELLGIPESMELYDMLVLGHAGMDPSAKRMRPLKEMIHYDACGNEDFRTDDQVRAFFEQTK